MKKYNELASVISEVRNGNAIVAINGTDVPVTFNSTFLDLNNVAIGAAQFSPFLGHHIYLDERFYCGKMPECAKVFFLAHEIGHVTYGHLVGVGQQQITEERLNAIQNHGTGVVAMEADADMYAARICGEKKSLAALKWLRRIISITAFLTLGSHRKTLKMSVKEIDNRIRLIGNFFQAKPGLREGC